MFTRVLGRGLFLVALRKESVDRNYIIKVTVCRPAAVALRKESVDRNEYLKLLAMLIMVALRKESVDRNDAVQVIIVIMHGRSPQGERG